MKSTFSVLICMMTIVQSFAQTPVRVAIAGLSHGHVDWFFNRDHKDDITLVGIYEPNKDLAKKYASKYNIDPDLFFTDLDEMIEKVNPDAVSAFGATSEYINVVRSCAPKKIHVMVEKPLATTLEDAKEILSLARKHSIHVLTNYETSWYASNQYVKDLVEKGRIGEIKKVMVNSGHQGPKEIGVSDEFLEILVDPAKNGAGALMDFGCYGANLMTWLLNGERPLSVTAITNQNKPEIYTDVEDEATIVLQYEDAQCVIQASWDWTFSRKDMEVYGSKAYAIAEDPTTVKFRSNENSPEEEINLNSREAPFNDPFSYLAAVVTGKIYVDKNNLYGLPINLVVVEILEAAKKSAELNETIFLKESCNN